MSWCWHRGRLATTPLPGHTEPHALRFLKKHRAFEPRLPDIRASALLGEPRLWSRRLRFWPVPDLWLFPSVEPRPAGPISHPPGCTHPAAFLLVDLGQPRLRIGPVPAADRRPRPRLRRSYQSLRRCAIHNRLPRLLCGLGHPRWPGGCGHPHPPVQWPARPLGTSPPRRLPQANRNRPPRPDPPPKL